MDNIWTLSFYSLAMMMLGIALNNIVSLIVRTQKEKKEWTHNVDMRMLDVRLLERDVKWLKDCEYGRMKERKQTDESKDQ